MISWTDESTRHVKEIPRNAESPVAINALYGDSRIIDGELVDTYATGIISKNSAGETLDSVSVVDIVESTFGGVMRGAVYTRDEINFESNTAIKRIGSYTFDGTDVQCDSNYGRWRDKFNYVYANGSRQAALKFKTYGDSYSVMGGSAANVNTGYEIGGNVLTGGQLVLFLPNLSVQGDTKESYLAKCAAYLTEHPVTVNFEVNAPVITPIVVSKSTLEVAPGGYLEFTAADNVPVKSAVTFSFDCPCANRLRLDYINTAGENDFEVLELPPAYLIGVDATIIAESAVIYLRTTAYDTPQMYSISDVSQIISITYYYKEDTTE